MKYTNILISTLETATACYEAVEAIESDFNNYVGGFKAWNSGYACDMLKGAKTKIASIERKLFKLESQAETAMNAQLQLEEEEKNMQKELFITNDTNALTCEFETVEAGDVATIIKSSDKEAKKQAIPFKFTADVDYSDLEEIDLNNFDLNRRAIAVHGEAVKRHIMCVNRAYMSYYIHETFKALKDSEHEMIMDGHFKNRVTRKFKELSGLETAKVSFSDNRLSLAMRFECGGIDEDITLAGWQQAHSFDFNKLSKGYSDNGSEYWASVRLNQVIPVTSKSEVRKRLKAFIKASESFTREFEQLQGISHLEYANKLKDIQRGVGGKFVHINNAIESRG